MTKLYETNHWNTSQLFWAGKFLHQHLAEHVLHSGSKLIDQRHGGLNDCVQDDGEVLSMKNVFGLGVAF